MRTELQSDWCQKLHNATIVLNWQSWKLTERFVNLLWESCSRLLSGVLVCCSILPTLEIQIGAVSYVATPSPGVVVWAWCPYCGASSVPTQWGFGNVTCWCVSAGLLAESGPGQGYIQLLVVLDQGRVSIVEDQLSQRWVQVVGLSEAVACRRPVDHTVLHVSIHTAMESRWVFQGCFWQVWACCTVFLGKHTHAL